MILNPKIGVFSNFFEISGCDTHFLEWIVAEWLEIDMDNLCIKFLARNAGTFLKFKVLTF